MRHTFMQAGIVTGLVCQVLVANAAITGWRNDGTGKYLDANSLTTWSRTNSVIWKTPLPKHSNASPVIVGKRIFVCQEYETLTCLSTQDGSINWNRTVDWTAFVDTNATPKRPNAHGVNGYSTPTPLTDGKHVYVVFGSGVAAAFDMKGNQLWARLVGKSVHGHGHSASPIMSGGKLIIHMGNKVHALNPRNGKPAWTTDSKSGWGSPLPLMISGKHVLLTPGGDLIQSTDGKIIAKSLAKMPWTSPVLSDGTVYVVDESEATAIRLPTLISKDSEFTRLWTASPKKDRYYSSCVVHEGLVYNVNRKGFLSCIDAETGEIVYEQRLPVQGTVYPSPCLAGKNLLVSSDSGDMVLIKPGRTYQQIVKNKLEPFRSCPTFRKGRMYVRTLKHLYCIGNE